jgi:hypothetical protein
MIALLASWRHRQSRDATVRDEVFSSAAANFAT